MLLSIDIVSSILESSLRRVTSMHEHITNVNTKQADNVTGRIVNDFHFKMGIYGSPLLSDSKKFAIVQDLEPCLASELPLPHPISTYNRTNMNEGRNLFVLRLVEQSIYSLHTLLSDEEELDRPRAVE